MPLDGLALGPAPGSPPRQPRWGPRPQRELTLTHAAALLGRGEAWPQALPSCSSAS
jgi:hypothetical protein